MEKNIRSFFFIFLQNQTERWRAAAPLLALLATAELQSHTINTMPQASEELGMNLMSSPAAAPGMAGNQAMTGEALRQSQRIEMELSVTAAGGSAADLWETADKHTQRGERKLLLEALGAVGLYLCVGVAVFTTFETHGDGASLSLLFALISVILGDHLSATWSYRHALDLGGLDLLHGDDLHHRRVR